jgi:hypothetical protein
MPDPAVPATALPAAKTISRDFRTGLVVAVVVGCGAGIAWLLAYGSPTNGIHETALTGFFLTGLLTLAGNCMAYMIPAMVEIFKK